MKVLWVLPDFYSFLVEELDEIQPFLQELTVLSQPSNGKLLKFNTYHVEADKVTFLRLITRLKYVFEACKFTGPSFTTESWRIIKRAARITETIDDISVLQNLNIIHSHFAQPWGTCAVLARSMAPKVVSLRGFEVNTVTEIGYGYCLKGFYRKVLKKSLKLVDAITVASTTTMASVKKLGINSEKIHLIPNGVDIQKFQHLGLRYRSSREALGVEKNSILILAAGNLVQVKDFPTLIKAFAEIVKLPVNSRLIILGDGSERQSLEALVAELGLVDRIALPGSVPVDEMCTYYAACDTFVHPSMCEGFGNVVVEAMASGKAVIASNTGVAKDEIMDGENGFIFEPGNVEQLVAALKKVLGSKALRDNVSKAAQQSIIGKFDKRKRAESFVALYKQVLSSKAQEIYFKGS